MSRAPFQVTDDKRNQVKNLSGLGFRHEDIALKLETTPKTLRKHFRYELDLGAIEANAKVLDTLFNMATTGQNVTACIFWAKTRCGWREKPRDEAPAEPESPPALPSLRVVVD